MMRHFCRVAALAGLAGAGFLVNGATHDALAQGAPAAAQAPAAPAAKSGKAPAAAKAAPAKAAAKKDPAEAQKLIDAGIASYNGGKHELAVQQLSSALAGGSLPPALMARALHYRASAYRKQSKPALAISDYTSALWLKNGLNDTERADALAGRSMAYREAGLPDQADAEQAKAGKPGGTGSRSATEAAVAARPAAADQPVQTGALPGAGTPVPGASASRAPAPAATPAPAPVAVAKPSALAVHPHVGLADPAAGAPVPAAGQASTGGVGDFLSGLFGGSSSSSPAPAPAPTAAAPAQPAVSGWNQGTEVKAKAQPRAAAPPPPAAAPVPPAARAAAAPKAAQAVAVAAPAAPPAAAAGTASGRFKLQVAAVRSREEAQSAAQKLKQMYGAELGARDATIDAAEVGSLGTFYRVRVGPFANANEPRDLCTKLKPAGFDCLVVTQ